MWKRRAAAVNPQIAMIPRRLLLVYSNSVAEFLRQPPRLFYARMVGLSRVFCRPKNPPWPQQWWENENSGPPLLHVSMGFYMPPHLLKI
jgi:hypothetical protein